MEEILHQLIASLSNYLQVFAHLRWLAGFLNHQQYHPSKGSKNPLKEPPLAM